MTKIAITQRVTQNRDYFEIREQLDIRWGELFKKIDFLPIVLPYNYDFKKFNFDGVILSGGNDISEFEFRDNFELELIDFCIKNNIPIFGVCRGMQIIAKYFNSKFKKVSNQVNIEHKLYINNQSKYKKYLLDLDIVNSYHNIAVDTVGDGLIVSAWNRDVNIIKAIEHKEYKIFAQMWHSERVKPFKINELNLIREFFNMNKNNLELKI